MKFTSQAKWTEKAYGGVFTDPCIKALETSEKARLPAKKRVSPCKINEKFRLVCGSAVASIGDLFLLTTPSLSQKYLTGDNKNS